MTAEFARGEHIRVKSFPGKGGDCSTLLITFAGRQAEPSFATKNLGLPVANNVPYDRLSVISDENTWYQYGDIGEIYDKIARFAKANYRDVVGFGVDMGGYEVCRASAQIAFDRVLALSPQYSVQQRFAPFEGRWRDDAKGIRFLNDPASLNPATHYYLAFDPHVPADEKHVDRLLATRPLSTGKTAQFSGTVTVLPIDYAGSPLVPVLQQTRLLSALVRQVINNKLKPERFLQQIAGHRLKSPLMMANAVTAYTRQGNLKAAMDLARDGTERFPATTHLWQAFAALLERSGRLDEGLRAAYRGLAINPDHVGLKRVRADILARRNSPRDIKEAIQDEIRVSPENPFLYRRLAELLLSSNDVRGAKVAAAQAIEASRMPVNAHLDVEQHLYWAHMFQRRLAAA